MEFYDKMDGNFGPEEQSFNSQRDGILRDMFRCDNWTRKSFNSQRDGILPVDLAVCYLSRSVSIPNGMEFYLRKIGNGQIEIFVSIPNGMEFYWILFLST